VTSVERAAHLYGCFYSWKAAEICKEEGISAADMKRGYELYQARRDQQLFDARYYGSPEYGRITLDEAGLAEAVHEEERLCQQHKKQ